MKRSALLILTFVYLVSCVGIAVNRYYCCGKLASVKLVYGELAKNSHQKGKKRPACCRNEVKTFKINDTYFNSQAYILGNPSPVTLPYFTLVDFKLQTALPQAVITYYAKAPPGSPHVPIYTLDCDYRI